MILLTQGSEVVFQTVRWSLAPSPAPALVKPAAPPPPAHAAPPPRLPASVGAKPPPPPPPKPPAKPALCPPGKRPTPAGYIAPQVEMIGGLRPFRLGKEGHRSVKPFRQVFRECGARSIRAVTLSFPPARLPQSPASVSALSPAHRSRPKSPRLRMIRNSSVAILGRRSGEAAAEL